MKIARIFFLAVGILSLSVGGLWIQVDKQFDILNAGALVVGITMIFCGFWIFREAENPNLKPMEEEMEEE